MDTTTVEEAEGIIRKIRHEKGALTKKERKRTPDSVLESYDSVVHQLGAVTKT